MSPKSASFLRRMLSIWATWTMCAGTFSAVSRSRIQIRWSGIWNSKRMFRFQYECGCWIQVWTSCRRTMHRDIESFIRSLYPDANLTLFGSSCNGFGLADSDVDICLEFESNPDGKVSWNWNLISFRGGDTHWQRMLFSNQDLNMPSIVKKLAKHFRKNRLFCNVVPIASAKVPIVKLKHRLTSKFWIILIHKW